MLFIPHRVGWLPVSLSCLEDRETDLPRVILREPGPFSTPLRITGQGQMLLTSLDVTLDLPFPLPVGSQGGKGDRWACTRLGVQWTNIRDDSGVEQLEITVPAMQVWTLPRLLA